VDPAPKLAPRLLDALASRLPPRQAAYCDWIQPAKHASWGGPMNGQAARRSMTRCLAARLAPDLIIETGTYRGETTAFLADISEAAVETVESAERYYWFARWRLASRPSVNVSLGDSREFLSRVAGASPRSARPLIYLDAHWGADLPLPEELDIVASSWPQAVVLVDDFQVPDDPGYGFDDYGVGARLTSASLPPSVDDWERLYPVTRANQEVGARRGCIVLVGPDIDAGPLLSCGLRTVR
jgi:predicted O-methyltransferase YrrM